jgi:TatA/E family protein of Tat protein translocase
MPGFHGIDLVVIMVIALLIFGPKRLPEMGNAIGKSISSFKKGMSELTAPKEEKLEAYEAVEHKAVTHSYKEEKPEAYEAAEHEAVTHSYSAPTPEITHETSAAEISDTESSIK